MPDRSPAEQLRMYVVLTVLISILVLAAGLYALIGYIVISKGTDAVPDALWLAAGTYGGALVTWLVNSKGGTDAAPAGTAADPVNVKTAETPLEVTPAVDQPATRRKTDAGRDWAVGDDLPVVALDAA